MFEIPSGFQTYWLEFCGFGRWPYPQGAVPAYHQGGAQVGTSVSCSECWASSIPGLSQ